MVILPESGNHLGNLRVSETPVRERKLLTQANSTPIARHESSTPASELPAIGFLAEVSSEHRSFLACFGKFLRPQSGDILIAEGDAQESLYVVLSGSLHIVSAPGDRPILLAAFGEGDSIGEINLFDPATASATAVIVSHFQLCNSTGNL